MSYEEALERIDQCLNRAPINLDTEADLEWLKDFLREKLIEEPSRLEAEHTQQETISRLEDELLDSSIRIRDLEDEVSSLRSDVELLRASRDSFSGSTYED